MDDLTGITVLPSYPKGTPSFPLVTVEEIINDAFAPTKDTSGFHHSDISLEINIFSNKLAPISEVKGIRKTVDALLSDEYGMYRGFSGTTPNMDTNIYRYTMRFTGVVDKDRKIYRG